MLDISLNTIKIAAVQTRMTKSQLMAALGFETQAELAGYFGLTASAISQWVDDKPVPLLRELQARQRSPDAFCDSNSEFAAAAGSR